MARSAEKIGIFSIFPTKIAGAILFASNLFHCVTYKRFKKSLIEVTNDDEVFKAWPEMGDAPMIMSKKFVIINTSILSCQLKLTISSIFPYLFFLIPDALVATQPPNELNSIESESIHNNYEQDNPKQVRVERLTLLFDNFSSQKKERERTKFTKCKEIQV
uniref:Uncharacterized protein n=1 Tax=Romanomermis culicivorax TaxID=13658 RepID=A0A915JXS4_ROMCU